MHSQPSVDMRCRIAEALLSWPTRCYLFVDWSGAVYGYDEKPTPMKEHRHWEAGVRLGCWRVLDLHHGAPIADWDMWAYDVKLHSFFCATGE